MTLEDTVGLLITEYVKCPLRSLLVSPSVGNESQLTCDLDSVCITISAGTYNEDPALQPDTGPILLSHSYSVWNLVMA